MGAHRPGTVQQRAAVPPDAPEGRGAQPPALGRRDGCRRRRRKASRYASATTSATSSAVGMPSRPSALGGAARASAAKVAERQGLPPECAGASRRCRTARGRSPGAAPTAGTPGGARAEGAAGVDVTKQERQQPGAHHQQDGGADGEQQRDQPGSRRRICLCAATSLAWARRGRSTTLKAPVTRLSPAVASVIATTYRPRLASSQKVTTTKRSAAASRTASSAAPRRRAPKPSSRRASDSAGRRRSAAALVEAQERGQRGAEPARPDQRRHARDIECPEGQQADEIDAGGQQPDQVVAEEAQVALIEREQGEGEEPMHNPALVKDFLPESEHDKSRRVLLHLTADSLRQRIGLGYGM